VDHNAPALFASSLFVFNMFLAGIFLNENFEESGTRSNDNISDSTTADNDKKNSNEAELKECKKKTRSTKRNFWENAKSCFSSRSLASVIGCLLIFSWMIRATSYASMGSYYEDMYGFEPHTRGYIQSYQRVWVFIVQSSLIQPVLERAGGERQAVFFAAVLLAGSTFFEAQQNFVIFLCAICPSIALSTTMMGVSLRSLLTQLAPGDAIFSVFAAIDVLQNATAVTVPFYRAFLFRLLSSSSHREEADYTGADQVTMEGDPDPVTWVVCAGFHWVIASLAMLYLLRLGQVPIQSGSKESLASGKKDL